MQGTVIILGEKLELGKTPDYVSFHDVAVRLCHQQCQHARHYLRPDHNPTFGDRVRWKGKIEDYHFLEIHKDDVELFVRLFEFHTAAGELADAPWRKGNG